MEHVSPVLEFARTRPRTLKVCVVERADENAFEGGFPTKGCLNQLMGGNEFEGSDKKFGT